MELKGLKNNEYVHIIQEAFVFGIIVFFFVAIFSGLIGCASLDQGELPGPKSGVVYMYDLKGTVNDTPFDGVGVIPYANVYNFKIESRVDVDLIDINSCGRNFHQESAIKSGWFQPRRAFEYEFTPDRDIENYGSCLVRIGAFNKDQGQNAWAIIDFETPDASLPARVLCNGELQPSSYVSICQAKAGLIQRIAFDVPVKQDQTRLDPRCQMKSSDGKNWEYAMPAGECVMAFLEIGGEHRLHRHTTVAYTDYLIRGN